VEIGFLIRENYLQQSPYSPVDAFCPMEKQYQMLKIFFKYYETAVAELEKGKGMDEIFTTERKIILRDLKNIPGEKLIEIVEDVMRRIST